MLKKRKVIKVVLVCGLILMVGILFSSCDNIPVGNNFLSKPPALTFTKDSVFTSKSHAKQLLTNLYATLPYPLSNYYTPFEISKKRALGRKWTGTMVSLTDLAFTESGGGFYKGWLTALGGGLQIPYHFATGIQWKCFYEGWTLINNIDRVPDMSQKEKERWKAEAKTIMALQYIIMFRFIGGVVWVNKAYKNGDKIPPKPRITAMASVDSISALLNSAIPKLPLQVPNSELGRMTKVSAAALKTRLLLFAASPLMNSDKPYMEGKVAADKLVWMGGYKPKLWERAAKAAKQTIDLINKSSYYGMVEPTEQDSLGYATAYRKGYFERGSGEALISMRVKYKPDKYPLDGQQYWSWFHEQTPTLNYAQMFPDKNGIPINESSLYDPKHPYRNRDPRFYVSLTSDISMIGTRRAQMWIGGRDRPTENYGLAAGGFFPRKYVYYNNQNTFRNHLPMQFSYIRIPEIYLSYAEALAMENNTPTAEAYKYVNKVRNRVGLDKLQKIMKDPSNLNEFIHKVLKERARELGFENVRWYDMVRWKRKDLFTKKLLGLDLYKEPDGSLKYEAYDIATKAPRDWQTNFSPKWYLMPLPQSEINKGYGLIQNPGWEQ
jgi:hypothetical protein